MQLWDDDKLEELIQEAELCDSKLPCSYALKTEDEAISIFFASYSSRENT